MSYSIYADTPQCERRWRFGKALQRWKCTRIGDAIESQLLQEIEDAAALLRVDINNARVMARTSKKKPVKKKKARK